MAMDNMRHPVAQGGMWNTAKPQYSNETQKLLKEMMKESKLTNFQQRQLDKVVKDGKTLPKTCHPTSSAKPRVQTFPTKPNSAVIDPRKYNPAVRTQDKIEATGAYDRELYQPAPQTKYGGFYEKDKVRLANMMAYGEDIEPTHQAKVVRRPKAEKPDIDRFDELQAEMEERQKFLADMEALGQGEKYRTIINTELSQLLREMEIIDKQRTSKLQRLIAAEEKKEEKAGLPVPDVS